MTAIVRVGYCENCHKDRRPKRGQIYIYPTDGKLAIGRVDKVTVGVTEGITPHLYLLIRANEKFVYYKKICLVCGVKREKVDDKEYLSLDETRMSSILKIATKEWNALVMLKDYWNEEVEKKW